MKAAAGFSRAIRARIHVLSVISMLGLIAAQVCSGSTGGSISGLVRDPSGATVADAQVKATNTATGVTQVVRSDAAGFYSFSDLPIGKYDLAISHPGFKEFQIRQLTVNVNSALRADATLEIGTENQAVTVSGSAVQIETVSTQNGDIINSTK